jgi:hypothetical protein
LHNFFEVYIHNIYNIKIEKIKHENIIICELGIKNFETIIKPTIFNIKSVIKKLIIASFLKMIDVIPSERMSVVIKDNPIKI